ncbi:MAG: LacI family DNA-binding transcriptional regulator [Lachnospiraceae bacterium]|nr:LacI family DNA-binding transcriptional regulator [Lachnospiraceae bacterium]
MTIRDVAKSSGVSISTVSRVLNGHPDVSEAVREKVMKAVEELHYVPNDSARSLVRAQTDTIGVVIRGIGNPFFASVMAEIEKAAAKAGYEIARTQIGAEEDELLAGASLVKSRRLKGLILLGGRFDYSAEDAQRIDVPFVCCTFTNSFGDLATEQYSSISINDYAEAYRATQYLTARGHQRIGIVLERREDHSISELRCRGYCDALRGKGLLDEALIAETGSFSMAAAYEATKKLITEHPEITALFVIADSMAIAAMKALYDLGRRVPEDCSVIAIDGIEMSEYTTPALTTLSQPPEVMARKAVKAMLDVIRDPEAHRHEWVKTTLREGGSVAQAR